jgi:transcriptional regulator with XRE-family HTH domain
MVRKLHNVLQKRKDEMYQYYYKGIGSSIRKRRLELKMTQEILAKGICSNTYISKIENNAIVVKRENLSLIMERMNLPISAIGFPEEMVEFLDRSFKLFCQKDVAGYERLMAEIKQYEFGILIQVARLGFFVLIGDPDSAKTIYMDLFRYLNTLEEYGLVIFILYACWYNVLICDYESARNILELMESSLYLSDDIFAMYHYLEYIVYGSLHNFHKARAGLLMARDFFFESNNLARMGEMMVYKNIFDVYEFPETEFHFSSEGIEYLSPSQRNFYLWMMTSANCDPNAYRTLFDPEGVYYQEYLYFLAIRYHQSGSLELYEETKNCLELKACQKPSSVDFYQLLILRENKYSTEYRENLINVFLPYAISLQNIHLMRLLTNEIVDILSKIKRYKDALGFQEKFKQVLFRLQNIKKYAAE